MHGSAKRDGVQSHQSPSLCSPYTYIQALWLLVFSLPLNGSVPCAYQHLASPFSLRAFAGRNLLAGIHVFMLKKGSESGVQACKGFKKSAGPCAGPS